MSTNINSKILSTIPEIEDQEIDEQPNNDDMTNIEQTNTLSTNISLLNPSDLLLNKKFHIAALIGDLNSLKRLLKQANWLINCRDKENSTALLLSCARGHYSCVELLLKNGADSNARRLTGATPLYFATLYHHTKIVQLLLSKYNAAIDLSTFDGSTPLHVACEHGFSDVVQLLIDFHVDVNAKMNDRTTPIMLACQNGHLSIVKMLLSTKTCDISIQRLDGITPLFMIVQNGHEAIFDYFTENVDTIADTIDFAREDGATPLFKACQKGYHSLTKKLLDYKPDLGLLRNGETCLHAATMFNHGEIVHSLLKYGANPLLNNWEGMTAIDLAKEGQLENILDIFLHHLTPTLSEHARLYLLHKSTRRTDADFNIQLLEHEENDEWKLYKTLKSPGELQLLQEEIEHIPILTNPLSNKHKRTNAVRFIVNSKPHRYHSSPLLYH